VHHCGKIKSALIPLMHDANMKSKNVDCDSTFEASFPSPEPHLLTQEDSNYLVRDFNLSKKTSWTLRFSIKKVESSPPKY
jgi:hypothetical protein